MLADIQSGVDRLKADIETLIAALSALSPAGHSRGQDTPGGEGVNRLRPETIGARLKILRANRSLRDFAADLGDDIISSSGLHRYESDDERVPNAKLLARVCELTGADPRWLLLGQGLPPAPPPAKDVVSKDGGAE